MLEKHLLVQVGGNVGLVLNFLLPIILVQVGNQLSGLTVEIFLKFNLILGRVWNSSARLPFGAHICDGRLDIFGSA